ncbi:hypothetical protein NL676_012216 [Syzygium grande]|nr:hypothetical protein NL676_012216 [Syzygium grande]
MYTPKIANAGVSSTAHDVLLDMNSGGVELAPGLHLSHGLNSPAEPDLHPLAEPYTGTPYTVVPGIQAHHHQHISAPGLPSSNQIVPKTANAGVSSTAPYGFLDMNSGTSHFEVPSPQAQHLQILRTLE